MTASQWQKKGVLGNVVPSSPLEEAGKPELSLQGRSENDADCHQGESSSLTKCMNRSLLSMKATRIHTHLLV